MNSGIHSILLVQPLKDSTQNIAIQVIPYTVLQNNCVWEYCFTPNFGTGGGSRWDWFCVRKKVGELCGSFYIAQVSL